ncbi:hypothetical protein [Plebeiibacterium sediminum]|uniref:Uncharacterized protein n=1 Tax=Plebeiibacterium sediminum TaxID=2992112 RepID=A0AAE3SF98_9BACT|nr:hypothetical protein [Plebeiobacterium sediminum]MCW3786842.1 hypothetical protein [Plebeiobacterium sediminum]
MNDYNDLKEKLIVFKNDDETNKSDETKEKDSVSLELINTMIESLEISYDYKTSNTDRKIKFLETDLLQNFFITDDMDLIKERLKELRALYNDIIENN